jgi:hypothetical protein
MGLLSSGKIYLSLYDTDDGKLIREPIQIKVFRDGNLIGTYIVRDGKLAMKRLPRIENKEFDDYYRYKFEIISNNYNPTSLACEFDKHTRKINMDILLESKGQDSKTRMY